MFLRRELLLLAVMVVIVLASVAHHSYFWTSRNISFILADSMVITFLALGETFVLLSRGVDLSIAPIMGLSAVIVGFRAQDHGMTLLPAVLLGAVVGLVLGLGNAVLVAVLRLPPIIATLGTLSVYGGLQFVVTGGDQVDHVPTQYTDLGSETIVWGIPTILLIGVAAVIVTALVLRHTRFGRAVYATGNDLEAAYRSGIRTNQVIFACYVICGLFAGLAGVVYLMRTGSAVATTGTDNNSNLNAIAAALIGGTALTGGRGSAIGAIAGSVFLSLTLTAMVFAGIPAIWQPAGVGAAILIAVLADGKARRQNNTFRLGRLRLRRSS
ncbi:ABC transporter permease [Rugosimonospora acidiphila]|uniref:Autoinducer 2 import system permease protein LsrC n=1 Tax=Rugosimonospora acidiphila TaxID=556531 RepID=A0ABP9SSW3_9ACTN